MLGVDSLLVVVMLEVGAGAGAGVAERRQEMNNEISTLDDLKKSLVGILGEKFNFVINDGRLSIQTSLFVGENDDLEYVDIEEKAISHQKLTFYFDDNLNLVSSSSVVKINP